MYLVFVILYFVFFSRPLLHPVIFALSDNLEKLHFKMYTDYCGDTMQCDNITAHLEPTDFVLPLPCCVPCSCLPTCWNNQNCCPAMWNHTRFATDNGTVGNTFQENDGSISVTNDILKVAQPFKVGTEIEAWTNKDNSTEAFLRRRFTTHVQDVENTDDLVSKEGKEMESLNGLTYKVEAVCTRPQVLYEPNTFLDSKAYMMVVTCKSSFQNATIRDKCYAGWEDADFTDMIPVTSGFTSVTYVNKYCLLCNELEALDSLLVDEWQAKIVSNSVHYFYQFVLSLNSLKVDLLQSRFGNSNVHFEPNVKKNIQECKKYDITSCNQTGLLGTYDETIERICNHGHSLPILHPVTHKRRLFKNIACVYCNVADGLSGVKPPCINNQIEGKAYKYSLSLNIKSIQDDSGGQEEDLAKDVIIQKPTVGSCPSGCIDLVGRCRRLYCPRDHYKRKNKCLPLYKVMTGLDLNVKITATPNQDIREQVSHRFIAKLKETVNKTISNTITLQTREIAVLYRQKSENSPVIYYLFDIYFFNASDIILFDDAVKEIQVFFNALNTQKVILENENEISLQFEFSHRVETKLNTYIDGSVGRGGILRPLMDKLWKVPIRKPYMTISNLHWRFRVAFDLFGEAERMTRYEYRIKTTNITVYNLEYDLLYSKFGDTILIVCIDLFTSLMNLDERRSRVKTRISFDEIEKNHDSGQPLSVRSITVITVCAMGGLLLMAVLCKVQFSSLQTLHNPNLSENSNASV